MQKVKQNKTPLIREVVGRYGLSSRNERRDSWEDWCMTHDQVIMNTWFQHHKVYVKPKQKWMTKVLLDKMDTRRKYWCIQTTRRRNQKGMSCRKGENAY